MPSKAKAIRGQKLFNEIIRMSDQFEGKYKRAFLKSMLSITNDPELKSLIKDIANGEVGTGSNIGSRLDKVRIDIADMNELSRQTMVQAANITKKVMGIAGSFDVVNESVIEAARQMSIQLSTNLRASARENLRQVIEDFSSGNISRQEAVQQIQSNVGLLPQHAQAVKNYRTTLLNTGTPRIKANQLADNYAKRLLKYRAETIARTEVGRAVGIGKTNYWRQMQSEGYLPPDVSRVWITEPVGACQFCLDMNGEPATIDGGWNTSRGYLEYPKASHPNCRCDDGIALVSKKKSKIGKNDEIEWREWIAKGESVGHPFRGNQWVVAGVSTPRKGRLKTTDSELPVGHESATPFTRDEYRELSTQARKNTELLNGEEEDSFGHYFGDNYRGINNLLRHGDEPEWQPKIVGNRYYDIMKEYVAGMETGYKKASIEMPRDTTVYRGVFVPKGQEFQVGDVISDKSYSSTTASPDVAIRFSGTGENDPASKPPKTVSTVFAIVLPKGYKAVVGGGLASYGGEQEILLDKNTKMKVVAVEKWSEPSDSVSCDKVTVEIVP